MPNLIGTNYANTHNIHTGNMLSSDQGILQGCGGCVGNGGGIIQARGIVGRQGGGKKRRRRRGGSRKKRRGNKRGGSGIGTQDAHGGPVGSLTSKQQQRNATKGVDMILRRGQLGGGLKGNIKGNGYGMTTRTASKAADGSMGYGSTPVAMYEDCRTFPAFKMGASRPYSSIHALQSGAGKNLTVAESNNLSNAGYGFKGGVVPVALRHNVHAPITSTSYEQTCQRAGRRKRRKTRGGRKTRRQRRRSGAGWATRMRAAAARAKAAAARAKAKAKAKAAAARRGLGTVKTAAAARMPGWPKRPNWSRRSVSAVAPDADLPSAVSPPPAPAPVPTVAAPAGSRLEKLNEAARGERVVAEALVKATEPTKGGGARNLFDAVAAPFYALGDSLHNTTRSMAQSSAISKMVYPSQAGGRRSRRKRRGGKKRTRRRRAGGKLFTPRTNVSEAYAKNTPVLSNCWSWPGTKARCSGGGGRRTRRQQGGGPQCWSWPGAGPVCPIPGRGNVLMINNGVSPRNAPGASPASGGGHRCRKRRKHTKKRRRKPRRKHRRKRHTKRRRRKRQRGGYAQYHSDIPLTSTMSLPAGRAGGSWEGQLASPPTYTRLDNCHNNYNHYTGKNFPSPVTDGAAPPVPTLGGN